jgi:hypothetical protein
MAGGAGALLAFLAALVFLPSLVEGRLRATLARRGLSFAAADFEVGLSGVALEDVRIGFAGAPQPFARLAQLEVDVSLLGLARGLRESVGHVRLTKADVRLTAAELKRLRGQGGSAPGAQPQPSEPSEPAAPLPSIEVQHSNISVRDEVGPLLVVEGLSAELAEGKWKVRADNFAVGAEPGDVMRLQGAVAGGSLAGRRPVLELASAEGALMSWAASAQRASGGSTLARIRAVREALRSSRSEPAAASGGARAAFWSKDARVELRKMRVLDSEAGGAAIMDGLDITLEAADAGAFRVTGKGRSPGAGQVSWDLSLVPSEARVEGKLTLQAVPFALFGPVLPPLPFYQLDDTLVDADLELTGRGLESVAVKGALTVQRLAFASDGLARTPVGPFTFEARGEGTWTPARRELSSIQARVSSGAVSIGLSGALAWPTDGYRVDVLAELPKTRCEKVLAAVPAGLLDELSTVELSGTLGGKLAIHVDAADLDATKVDFDIKDACEFGALPPLLDLGRFQRPFLHQVLEPDGTMFEMETGPGSAAWTPIEHISPFLVQAVVAHEDGRFFGHRGFAEPEIAVALSRNLKAKAFRFGASTITMQLVKNVFLHRDKLLSRKIQEAFIVWWLEQHWDKRQIMELYLNVIEYGPAIYGIRNAALHYFGTIPMNLTPAQAAFFGSILPSPKSAIVHYEKKQLSNSAKSRIASLLKHMHARQRIDDEALAYGLEELNGFRFYDPAGPPPVPPQIRGTAQQPFNVPDPLIDAWDALPFGMPAETGSFGAP